MVNVEKAPSNADRDAALKKVLEQIADKFPQAADLARIDLPCPYPMIRGEISKAAQNPANDADDAAALTELASALSEGELQRKLEDINKRQWRAGQD